MGSKHFSFYLGFILILMCINSATVQAFRVNITRFKSCDIPGEEVDHLVYIRDVLYEFDAAGYCDTVHGKYRIPTVNAADKLLDITMFQCATGSSGICSDKPQTFHEHVHCDRFHNDKTGPWSMISDGMSGSHCGELEGEFTLDNATLKREYIANYIIQDPNFARHRLNIIIRKKAADTNKYILRGCVDIDFDIKY